MAAATFDTYAAAQALRDAGFSEPQAAAAVAMVRDAMAEGVATKADVADIKAHISEFKAYMTARLYAVAFAIVAANTALTLGLLRFLWPTGGG